MSLEVAVGLPPTPLDCGLVISMNGEQQRQEEGGK